VILPKTVESDFQTDDANAEIRKEAAKLDRLGPNADPLTRMSMLPEAAETIG
jgi:hypothetical protein